MIAGALPSAEVGAGDLGLLTRGGVPRYRGLTVVDLRRGDA